MGNIERVRERKREKEREGGRGPEAGKAPPPQLQLLPMSPWARGIQPHNKENSGKRWAAGSLCVGENAHQPEQRRPSSITTSSDSLHASQDELSAKLERFIIAPFACNKSRENIRIRKVLPICQDGCSAGDHPQWITASTTI